MKKLITLALSIVISLSVFSQVNNTLKGKYLRVTTDATIGTGSVEPSSIVNMSSTGKGLLIPRMTEANRNGISSPATGLVIYNTDDDEFNYYDGATWVLLGGGSDGNGIYDASGSLSGATTVTMGGNDINWTGGNFLLDDGIFRTTNTTSNARFYGNGATRGITLKEADVGSRGEIHLKPRVFDGITNPNGWHFIGNDAEEGMFVRSALGDIRFDNGNGATFSQDLQVGINTTAGTGNAFHVNGDSQFDGDTYVNGSVGVGVANPLAHLHINGTVAYSNELTFVDGDTSPSVSQSVGAIRCATANTGATSIVAIDNGVIGQQIIIFFQDGNTTVVNNANIQLNGSANQLFTNGSTLTLMKNTAGKWIEINRMVA